MPTLIVRELKDAAFAVMSLQEVHESIDYSNWEYKLLWDTFVSVARKGYSASIFSPDHEFYPVAMANIQKLTEAGLNVVVDSDGCKVEWGWG